MPYKHTMTDFEIAKAALKLLRENASLIADTRDSNRVWDFLDAVEHVNLKRSKDKQI